MAKYEVMLLTKTGLRDEEKETILKQVSDTITKSEGKVNKKNLFLDKHRLAFSVKKQKDGTYFIVEFEISSAALVKLNQTWKLNENILRFQIIRLDSVK